MVEYQGIQDISHPTQKWREAQECHFWRPRLFRISPWRPACWLCAPGHPSRNLTCWTTFQKTPSTWSHPEPTCPSCAPTVFLISLKQTRLCITQTLWIGYSMQWNANSGLQSHLVLLLWKGLFRPLAYYWFLILPVLGKWRENMKIQCATLRKPQQENQLWWKSVRSSKAVLFGFQMTPALPVSPHFPWPRSPSADHSYQFYHQRV